MIKRKPARRSAAVRSRRGPVPASAPQHESDSVSDKSKSRATLSVLVYLCGDCHIEKYTDQYLESLLQSAPSKNIHLLVQYDTAEGANRYLVHAGASGFQKEEVRRDVNTGDQAALEEFLEWGLKAVAAEHHVLVLSGLGINPRYVRQSLRLDSLPEPLQKVRGGKPGDPNLAKYSKEFAEKVAQLNPKELAKYRDAIQQRTFSICHDFSNSGSLAISDLRQVLAGAVQKFSPIKRDPRFDLVLFDTGAAASVEVLFEREGLARVFVGSQGILFDNGSPYTEIFQNWNQLAGKSNESEGDSFSQELALSFMKSTQNESVESQPEFIGVNLETLDEVARVLDTLALALLHSLGAWHVLDAHFQATTKTLEWHRTSVCEPVSSSNTSSPRSTPSSSGARSLRSSRDNSVSKPVVVISPVQTKALDDIEFLPTVDLFALLDAIEVAFSNKLLSGEQAPPKRPRQPNGKANQYGNDYQSAPVPMSHGQHERIRSLYKLIRKTIAHLHSDQLHSGSGAAQAFLLKQDGEDLARRGVSILLPPARTPEEVQADAGRIFSLSSNSYSRLNLTRRVHWAALIDAIQMIHEKPHALWRVISSMLADASSTARDAALGRLVSSQSVISEMRQLLQHDRFRRQRVGSPQ